MFLCGKLNSALPALYSKMPDWNSRTPVQRPFNLNAEPSSFYGLTNLITLILKHREELLHWRRKDSLLLVDDS
jgi:hypothetical protein